MSWIPCAAALSSAASNTQVNATMSSATATLYGVVFESIEDYNERIDDPDLDVDETCVLVLKGCGPMGYPGMPEVGNFGLPKKVFPSPGHRSPKTNQSSSSCRY